MATDAAVGSLTELHAIQALLAETVAAERALDAELEALLGKRAVRGCRRRPPRERVAPRAAADALRSRRRWGRPAAGLLACSAAALRAGGFGARLPRGCAARARNPHSPPPLLPLQALAETLGGLDAAREVLEVVTADAEHVASSVAGTCALAERVSGKVRRPLAHVAAPRSPRS